MLTYAIIKLSKRSHWFFFSVIFSIVRIFVLLLILEVEFRIFFSDLSHLEDYANRYFIFALLLIILSDLLFFHVFLRLTELLLNLFFDQIWIGHMETFNLYLFDLLWMKVRESFQFYFKLSFCWGKKMKSFNLLV